MAQSIFLGPAAYAPDSPRAVEEKLNSYFAERWSSLSIVAPREIIRLTVSSDNATVDSVRETQRKINRNLALVAAASSASVDPVALSETFNLVSGLDPASVSRLNASLRAAAAGQAESQPVSLRFNVPRNSQLLPVLAA